MRGSASTRVSATIVVGGATPRGLWGQGCQNPTHICPRSACDLIEEIALKHACHRCHRCHQGERQLTSGRFVCVFLNTLQLGVGVAIGLVLREGRRQGGCWRLLPDHGVMTSEPGQATDLGAETAGEVSGPPLIPCPAQAQPSRPCLPQACCLPQASESVSASPTHTPTLTPTLGPPPPRPSPQGLILALRRCAAQQSATQLIRLSGHGDQTGSRVSVCLELTSSVGIGDLAGNAGKNVCAFFVLDEDRSPEAAGPAWGPSRAEG